MHFNIGKELILLEALCNPQYSIWILNESSNLFNLYNLRPNAIYKLYYRQSDGNFIIKSEYGDYLLPPVDLKKIIWTLRPAVLKFCLLPSLKKFLNLILIFPSMKRTSIIFYFSWNCWEKKSVYNKVMIYDIK